MLKFLCYQKQTVGHMYRSYWMIAIIRDLKVIQGDSKSLWQCRVRKMKDGSYKDMSIL